MASTGSRTGIAPKRLQRRGNNGDPKGYRAWRWRDSTPAVSHILVLFCDDPLSGRVSFNAAPLFVKESLHYRQVSQRKPTLASAYPPKATAIGPLPSRRKPAAVRT